MAEQLKGGFYSDNGGDYEVSIYNDSFVGSASNVVVNNLFIDWESQSDKIMEPLKASRCSFSFINDSTEVDTFITNLVNGNEDQFKIKVNKQNNLFWCGVILSDQVSFEDMPKGRIVTVTAIDGIGRLEDISFDYSTADQNTMLKYIYEALEYNGLSDFWSATDVYFKESSEFFETQMTNNGTQYSPFLQSRFDRTLFLTDEVNGEKTIDRGVATITVPTYTPVTCAEVLRQILLINSCRMFMSEGSYYIQQIRNFNSSTYNERSIRKSLVVASYQSQSHRLTEGTDALRLGDCRWTYFPPLQEVRINSVPRATLAQSGGGIQTLDSGTSPLVQTVQLGTLRGGSGSGKTILIQITAEVLRLASFKSVAELEINVEAGSYRLKSAKATPDVIEWTTTATDRVYRDISPYTVYVQDKSIVYLAIETPEFPSAKEDNCTISITYTENNFGSTGVMKIYPIEMLLLTDGNIVQEAQYSVLNTVSNSVIIQYEKPLLNDLTLGFTSKNSIEVNSTGSTWVFSDVWDAGYTADVSLVETLCLETMSFQDKAVEVLQGTLKVPESYIGVGTPYAPMFHLTYYYESKTFVFNGGRLNCLRDEFTGEWFRSIQDKTGWAIQQDSGDGNIYNKDIKIGTPKKKVYDNDHWTRQAMFTLVNKQLATLDEDLAPGDGPFTSIDITSLDRDIYDGDVVTVIHPVNNRVMQTFTLDTDASATATSLSVDSQEITEDIPAGALIVFNGETLRDSGIFRTTSDSTPPTGGFGGNGAIQVHLTDGKLYYQSNGDTYEVTGTIKT